MTWNGSVKPTTYASSGQLSIAVSDADLGRSGSVPVSVANSAPGGGNASATFTITDPVAPSLTSLSPSTAVWNGAAFALTVTGSGFVRDSTVRWNGSDRPTTFVSSTQLTAAISASDLIAAGDSPVSVVTPAPGGGISSTLQVRVQSPLPQITQISPAGVPIGSTALSLTVTGNNFAPGATVYFNGLSRVTTYVSSTELSAAIPASDLNVQTGINVPVTVANPSPSAGYSNAASFSLQNPVPQITAVTPVEVTAGAQFQLKITGTGFQSGAVIHLGEATITPDYVTDTYISHSWMTLPKVGAQTVTVSNPVPTLGNSNALTLNSKAAGNGLQLTLATLDPFDHIVDCFAPRMSPNGRYIAFDSYLRDTCFGAPQGCRPATKPYRQPWDQLMLRSRYDLVAGPPSGDGRYVPSQVAQYALGGTTASIDLTDTCNGVEAGCSPSKAVLVPDGTEFRSLSVTPDFRYLAYMSGGSAGAYNTNLVNTCVADSSGCAPTPLLLTSIPDIANSEPPLVSANARYAFVTETIGNVAKPVLHDTCIGAAPGCVPDVIPTVTFPPDQNCIATALSEDASFAVFSCKSRWPGSTDPTTLYRINTCIDISGCVPSSDELATLAVTPYEGFGEAFISKDGRFVAYTARIGEWWADSVFIHDSCKGASSGCTPRTQPVCLTSEGALADEGNCSLQGMSADGKYILVYTNGKNLPAGKTTSYVAANPFF